MWGHAPCPLPVRYRRLLQIYFMFNKTTTTISSLCLGKTTSILSKTSLMALKCSSVTFPFKGSISGNAGLSISNSSSAGLSGKFEQLDSPSSVSHLSETIILDEISICFNLVKIQILSLRLGQSQNSYFYPFLSFHI